MLTTNLQGNSLMNQTDYNLWNSKTLFHTIKNTNQECLCTSISTKNHTQLREARWWWCKVSLSRIGMKLQTVKFPKPWTAPDWWRCASKRVHIRFRISKWPLYSDLVWGLSRSQQSFQLVSPLSTASYNQRKCTSPLMLRSHLQCARKD